MSQIRSLIVTRWILSLVVVAPLVVLGGCQAASIAMKEKLGIPKREQMVDRVQDARDSQQEAKQQFKTTMEEFTALTGAKGSADLEAKYSKLQKSYDRSEAKATEVRSEISKVETVAEKLFAEWRTELAQYQDAGLRRSSEDQLSQTRVKYDGMVGAMKTAAAKMDPVLRTLKDRVLFLKHNLNAQAISALQGNVDTLQGDVSRLISEMEQSIAEANQFIDTMKK
jgi:hypothetical protein